MTTWDLTAEVRAPMRAGLMAIGIAVAAYVAAPAVGHALTFHAVQMAQSLIVAPVIEELFFRGVVQSRLRAAGGVFGRPWVAIGVTAVCFGLAHLLTASVARAALVIAPAVVIGWAYERTRSIGLCIALHSAANAVWIGYWSI
jgi:membrane protease YdiL (CAAX protease family)